MFNVSLTKTPMLSGDFSDWALEEMLDAVGSKNLTIVLKFQPSGIELLLSHGQFASARGATKLSQVLQQEGLLTTAQLQTIQASGDGLVAGLRRLGFSHLCIQEAMRTQVLWSLKTLFSLKLSQFSVYKASIQGEFISAALPITNALLEVISLQATEREIAMGWATYDRLTTKAEVLLA